MLEIVRSYLRGERRSSTANSGFFSNREREIAFHRGVLAGTREAIRQRHAVCARTQTVSGCIITQNSARYIERTLQSVQQICDEIIVVDGGSKDNTAAIVRSFEKVRYYHRPWPGNYIEQKNWAFSKATGDWILSIDDDEVAGSNIRRKISRLLGSKKYTSYSFPRYWLCSESPNRYVAADKLYPDYQQRLFRNIPLYRYTIERMIHHKFPDGLQGSGKKIKDAHIFHFAFLHRDRRTREQLVKSRKTVEPVTDHLNRNQHLFEERPHRIKRCKEKL
jgi:glycosyltransferase involved in cell wall biosynthesis